MFKDAAFEEETVELEPGDAVVAFSDGLTEALNQAGELFGDDRLLSCLATSRELEPAQVLRRLFDTVGQFTGGAPQSDDMTALVLRYFGR